MTAWTFFGGPALLDEEARCRVPERMEGVTGAGCVDGPSARCSGRQHCLCTLLVEWIAPFSEGNTMLCDVAGQASFQAFNVFSTMGDIGTSRLPASLFGGPSLFKKSARRRTRITFSSKSTRSQPSPRSSE